MEKIIKKYDKKPIKTNTYILSNLKVTLDDFVIQFMTKELRCTENFLFTDFRIAVGIVSTILASILAYLSITYDFNEYKTICAIFLLIYFVSNIIVEAISNIFRRNVIYVGKKEDKRISVKSILKGPNTIYTLLVDSNGSVSKYTKDIRDLFDEEGMFLHNIFFNELKKEMSI
ncbi:Signal peptidase complex subunit 2 [Astathelohania contejeani]|uniref:Signal peptidase complex subunit 2 n=1 Tax=Astathelohania contejeani TaxID=164912 RepID=A0ABQ7HZA0_9MICR|nr:Signal peptidase complex subunit 2 [Thelohania contejeani]